MLLPVLFILSREIAFEERVPGSEISLKIPGHSCLVCFCAYLDTYHTLTSSTHASLYQHSPPSAVDVGFLRSYSHPYCLSQTSPDFARETAWVSLQVSPAGSSFLLALPSPLWWDEEKGALVRFKNSGCLLEENQRRLGTEEQDEELAG